MRRPQTMLQPPQPPHAPGAVVVRCPRSGKSYDALERSLDVPERWSAHVVTVSCRKSIGPTYRASAVTSRTLRVGIGAVHSFTAGPHVKMHYVVHDGRRRRIRSEASTPSERAHVKNGCYLVEGRSVCSWKPELLASGRPRSKSTSLKPHRRKEDRWRLGCRTRVRRFERGGVRDLRGFGACVLGRCTQGLLASASGDKRLVIKGASHAEEAEHPRGTSSFTAR